MMTREYPPEVYGGAGVHVTELVAQLRHLCEVDVHCMGAPRPGVSAHQPDPALAGTNPALSALSAGVVMANAAASANLVHSHTWYTGLAGHLAAMLYGIPHVLTAHSLEPLRPWKSEQLGSGYRVSSWVEHTAVHNADAIIAVSAAMRDDVLRVYPTLNPDRVHVVHNGIDTDAWFPVPTPTVLAELGVDPGRPIVAFVGRITRQKGVTHLLEAAQRFTPEAQLVLVAGAPDTPEVAAEVSVAVDMLAAERTGVFWLQDMLPTAVIREILSAATVFVCPSVYEPLGIVNLEAMACQTAVVASDVGGIPEVVADGVTGTLVHYDTQAARDPEVSADYAIRLAEAVNALVADPDTAREYGRAGRQRCIEQFSWARSAAETFQIYRAVCG